MKRLAIPVCVLLLLAAAGQARAGTPGMNLSWDKCSTTASSGQRSYACDGALGTALSLQGTFRNAVGIPDFVGCSSVIDILFDSPTVPDYWRMLATECNRGALTISNPSSTPPCVTPGVFDPNFSGGGFVVQYPAPNRIRINADWATGPPIPPSITAGLLYPAVNLSLASGADVVNACAGCAAPACIMLESIEVFGFGPGEDYMITSQDIRQWVAWQGGSIGGAGCPPMVDPIRRGSWGSIKSLYR